MGMNVSIHIHYRFFPSPKVPQFPSNLFISVLNDNGGFFFLSFRQIYLMLLTMMNFEC
jgi:hypothetical protein